MSILLSDEETYRAYLGKPDMDDKVAIPMAKIFVQDSDRRIALAQLKKFVEWGEEICPDHWARREDGTMKSRTPRRLFCRTCWQSLKEEAGLT